jgi:hypothetical protein
MESALHKLNDVGKIYNETKGVNIMKREFAVKRYIKTYVCVFLVYKEDLEMAIETFSLKG